ncbi:M48 family metalloprotease [Chitinibacter fontanus]|uniref:M48 family metalloprotease n=1 Tax=Chitinibacter fontanus TaxID=1737446 RepID=A0A7D5VBD4_9NEIS|nr:M48 family metalloprotease [Chitinibacter fontanus]QLI82851.1 M48 family metalloprotease [Chitinibacter fontanus]
MKSILLATILGVSICSPVQALDLNKLLTGDNLNKSLSILSNAGDALSTSAKGLSAAQEESLGQSVMANLLGAEPLVNDAKLQRYVNQVGLWVAMQSSQPNLNWRFGVIDSPNINSFAATGGYILITRGLWDRLKTEAELAAVLGHEITHVTRKHHAKSIASAKGQQASSDLIALVVDYNNGKSGGKSLEKLGKAGSEVFIRGLDKNDEYEADINGMVLAARAGYNPYALVSVLQLLGNVSPADSSVALLFSTHPSPKDRLDNIDRVVGDKLEGYADGAETTKRFNQVKR